MDVTSPSVLDDFVKNSTRPWTRIPTPIPDAVVPGLWMLVGSDVAVAIWMSTVSSGHLACTSTLCSLTTFGGHEVVLGLVAGGCALALLALAAFTGAFRRAAMPVAAAICLLSTVSIGVVAGVLLAALLVLTAVAAVGLIILAVVVGFTAP
jgi:hypothetical protein